MHSGTVVVLLHMLDLVYALIFNAAVRVCAEKRSVFFIVLVP